MLSFPSQSVGDLWGLQVGFRAKIGANFAILAHFDAGLLNKSMILVHFLVELICGSFCEILS